jgi:hypothetical protein
MELLISITYALALIGVIAFVIWAMFFSPTARDAYLQHSPDQRLAALTAEACRYIEEVNQSRAFPTVDLGAVRPQAGEFGVLSEPATSFELQIRRRIAGIGTRIRVGRVPLYLGSAQSVPVETMTPVAVGQLCLTNRRLLFLSDRRSATVALQDLVAVDAGLETLTVHSGQKQRPLVLAVGNPQKWAVLLRLFSSQPVESPRLADGVMLHPEPPGAPGEVWLQAGNTR